MSPIKSLSVILFARLCCHVVTAKVDPSKYTVTFKYNDAVSWCLGGILDENILISAVECFADRSGEAFNYTSMKAVVGAVEVPVLKVMLPKFPPREGNFLRDYALVWLKDDLNLKKNGLTALTLPAGEVKVNSRALVSKDDGNEPGNYEIVDSKNCPNSDDVNFIAESHLCVELPKSDDRCLDQLGSPLVVEGDDGVNYVVGIYLDCYDDSAHEVFANTWYSGIGKPIGFRTRHVYP